MVTFSQPQNVNQNIKTSPSIYAAGASQTVDVSVTKYFIECDAEINFTVKAVDDLGMQGEMSNFARIDLSTTDCSQGVVAATQLSGGVIAGIAVGCFVLLVLLILLVCLCCNWRNRNEYALWKALTCQCCCSSKKRPKRNTMTTYDNDIMPTLATLRQNEQERSRSDVEVIRSIHDLPRYAERSENRMQKGSNQNEGFVGDEVPTPYKRTHFENKQQTTVDYNKPLPYGKNMDDDENMIEQGYHSFSSSFSSDNSFGDRTMKEIIRDQENILDNDRMNPHRQQQHEPVDGRSSAPRHQPVGRTSEPRHQPMVGRSSLPRHQPMIGRSQQQPFEPLVDIYSVPSKEQQRPKTAEIVERPMNGRSSGPRQQPLNPTFSHSSVPRHQLINPTSSNSSVPPSLENYPKKPRNFAPEPPSRHQKPVVPRKPLSVNSSSSGSSSSNIPGTYSGKRQLMTEATLQTTLPINSVGIPIEPEDTTGTIKSFLAEEYRQKYPGNLSQRNTPVQFDYTVDSDA